MHIRISKRFLVLVALAIALVIAALGSWQLVSSALSTARAEDAAVQSAEQVAITMLTMDYRDRDAWETKTKSMCTETGWNFWQIVVAQGLWDKLEAQQAVVEEVKVVGTKSEPYTKYGPLDPPGSYRLVTLDLEIHFQDRHVERQAFQAVMVYDDRRQQWLFHGLPFQGPLS